MKKLIAVTIMLVLCFALGTVAMADNEVVAKIGETEYTDLKKAFEDLATNGGTIELTKDAIIHVSSWESKTLTNVTVEGNGATITGLDSPFIGTATNVIVRNLKLEKPVVGNISGGGMNVSGAFVGYTSGTLTLENCSVFKGEVTSNDYSGGLLGYSGASSLKIIDCSVVDTIVTGATSGGMVGLANGNASISGTIGNNTLSGEKAVKEASVICNLPEVTDAISYINVIETAPSKGTKATNLYVVGRIRHTAFYLGGIYYSDPSKCDELVPEQGGKISFADGYSVVDNNNGTFSVKRDDINAKLGDTVTFEVKVEGEGSVAFYCGETKLGDATVSEGIATLSYNTEDGGIPAGNGNIITAKCGEGIELLKNDGKFTVNLEPREEPKPEVKPNPCDHRLDENGKCSRCGVIIISYENGKPSVGEDESNPDTGAESAIGAVAAIAVVSFAGAALSKKE